MKDIIKKRDEITELKKELTAQLKVHKKGKRDMHDTRASIVKAEAQLKKLLNELE